ncbi:hypothetical protein GPJ61_00145 [Brevibacillus formosus]|uniref:hypothetical protein n=1 Tax=Brevibacillus formosus TaxID=54913 RepID=UPI001CA5588E|nr:hypothetical protein [Brevibacillus formosus]MBW5466283.1 hypothetical protein [Brevibacillus formosus]
MTMNSLRHRHEVLHVNPPRIPIAYEFKPFAHRIDLANHASLPNLSSGIPFPPNIFRTRAYTDTGKPGNTNAILPSGNERISCGMYRSLRSRWMAVASRQGTVK